MRNSGEARYLANSASQSLWDIGGRDPVTGFHSVIDKLRDLSVDLLDRRMDHMGTYPDSVRRVSPPKTTIPNTLAALARSQYATAFELVSGKRDDCSIVLSALLMASVSLAVVLKDRRGIAHVCCICRRASLKSLRNARLLLID